MEATGCDVTHPSPGVRRPSVASLVASNDRELSKYRVEYAVQNPRAEIIEVSLALRLPILT